MGREGNRGGYAADVDGDVKRERISESDAGQVRRLAVKAAAAWIARGAEDGCPGLDIDNRNIKKEGCLWNVLREESRVWGMKFTRISLSPNSIYL